MKIPPANLLIPPRGARLRGVLYTTVEDGRMVIKKWPRRRPTPATPGEAKSRKLLQLMTIASLYMDAHQVLFSRELSKKSLLLPRDLLMLALSKRIGTIVLTDGRKLYSVVARQDVSSILDAITQHRGAMLSRGKNWWQEVPIGAEGQVLSVSPDGDLYWRDTASGLGVGGHWLFAAPPQFYDAASTIITSNYWVGIPVVMPADAKIRGVKIWLYDHAGLTHGFPAVYEAAAGGVLAGGNLIRQGAPTAISSDGLHTFPLSAETLLIGGHVYYIGLNLRGAGNYATANGAGRPNYYFSMPTDLAQDPAPAGTPQVSNNNPIWAY